MTAPASVGVAFRPLGYTPRTAAHHWRLHPADRPSIEADIAAANAWGEFCWGSNGELLMRITDEYQMRNINGASSSSLRPGPIGGRPA